MKRGVRIAYRPGDVILFRATLLEHFVSKFKGKHTVLVLHTKNNCWVWVEFKVQKLDPWALVAYRATTEPPSRVEREGLPQVSVIVSSHQFCRIHHDA